MVEDPKNITKLEAHADAPQRATPPLCVMALQVGPHPSHALIALCALSACEGPLGTTRTVRMAVRLAAIRPAHSHARAAMLTHAKAEGIEGLCSWRRT